MHRSRGASTLASLAAGLLLGAVLTVNQAAASPSSTLHPTCPCMSGLFCRCWNDPVPPGNIPPSATPQTVLVTLTSALNGSNTRLFPSLFHNISNPNGCPSLGTFFVQKLYSSPDAILQIHSLGHEIGVTSAEGTTPTNWTANMGDMWRFLFKDVGLPYDDVLTVRAPHLEPGGAQQFWAMAYNIFPRDSSCLTRDYMANDTMLWPYCYALLDHRPNCTRGTPSTNFYPDLWQFLIPELEINGSICATPDDCIRHLKDNDSEDVYKLLDQNFRKHYDHKRTPFIIELTPHWLSAPARFEGTRKFMQHVRYAFNDTWLVTHDQVMAYLLTPKPSDKAGTIYKWGCKARG